MTELLSRPRTGRYVNFYAYATRREELRRCPTVVATCYCIACNRRFTSWARREQHWRSAGHRRALERRR